ncbi:MAG: trypsin-like peptidase domain-containing protein [Lachnospiraceae bacterium]|nr:trypsin-like peptidase domain-containing protein [Lachnospiraceae bacterium]
MDEQNFNNNGNGSFFDNNEHEENHNNNSTNTEYGAGTWHEAEPAYSQKPEYGYTWQEPVRTVETAQDTTSGKKKVKAAKDKKKSHFFPKLCAAMAFGLAFGACAAGSFYAINKYVIKEAPAAIETNTNTDVEELQKSVAELQSALASSDKSTAVINTAAVSDVTSVVDKVMPSMVAITNKGEYSVSDWFGRRYTQDTESYGSGIIIGESDTEYFIATNNHVIEDNKSLSVLFVDETTAEAYVKGYDSSMDISVIAVSKDSLSAETKAAIKVATLGDSDSLKIGEAAIAIGNALGYGQSVTTGVVSALGREITIDGTTYSNLIQTSAAINPGNSGGALLNIYGEVVGINSSKAGDSQIDNMGFAIPISSVKDILKEFSDRETRNKVDSDSKGYLGIGGNDSYDVTMLGYPAGVYVSKVYEGSPAEAAGLYMGDVITKVEGQSVKTISELSGFLDYYKAGETVTLTVTRNVNGELKELTIDVTLGDKNAITESQNN